MHLLALSLSWIPDLDAFLFSNLSWEIVPGLTPSNRIQLFQCYVIRPGSSYSAVLIHHKLCPSLAYSCPILWHLYRLLFYDRCLTTRACHRPLESASMGYLPFVFVDPDANRSFIVSLLQVLSHWSVIFFTRY